MLEVGSYTCRNSASMYSKLMRFLFCDQPKFDHHLRTKEGDTPLMLAAYKGRVPVLEFLLRSAVYSEASQHDSD
ncbi:ankyrin-1-like [Elysia marginata]|uniref:Ankyrin-1-like n=1 Tax=Elysia marginata TaxID=1093978 RepID=A0AAV4FK72_9GAST|nr:ankyrin-1-like [Elysia marginata]